MPGTIPAIGLLIVRSDPGVGTFDFDRQKPGINSEAVTKSVPRGFLKVTLGGTLDLVYCNLKSEHSNSIEKNKQEQKHAHFLQCIVRFVSPSQNVGCLLLLLSGPLHDCFVLGR